MKKVVCGCFGTIYYATILKNGLMSDNRVDITDDAIFAVLQHLTCEKGYEENGFYGYEFKNNGVPINLIAYDRNKYKLVKRENGE